MSAETRAAEVLADEEREAIDRASSVLGWQHLARYSGQSQEWLDLTLAAMVRSVFAVRLAARDDREGETVWTVAYDGEPKMGGGHHTIRQGEFRCREDAEYAFSVMTSRSGRAPKPNMRIESRTVTEWSPVTADAQPR